MVLPGLCSPGTDFVPAENLRWEFRGIVPADLACCNQAASFLQSGFWGSFKARFGWNARSFLLQWDAPAPPGFSGTERRISVKQPLLLIRRRLAPGVSFAYVPWGPELPEGSYPDAQDKNRFLQGLAEALHPLLPDNTAFIRFDPPWFTEGEDAPPPPLFAPLSHSAVDVQPPDTVLVDLTPSEEEILRQMKTKCRYNIGLAKKRGVQVRLSGVEDLEAFYALYQETAKRDGINIHNIGYYQALFAHCQDYPGQELRLYLAEYEGKTLAANIVLFRRTEGVYLYGASSNQNRNLMATYALQWQAMRDAKAAGCTQYDLFGIPPRPDPSHPMAGLYQFKTGFGGRIIHRPGSWDYTYKPLVWRLFVTLESLRKGLWNKKKRRRGRKPV